MKLTRQAALGIATCVLLAGCGGGGDSGGDGAPATLPACARPAKSIERPAKLPPDLPIPPGTRFLAAGTPFPGQLLVTAHTPGTLADVRSYFDEELEDAGYKQGRTESEAGVEIEALFSGRGVRGGWTARVIPDCDGAAYLTVVVFRS